MNFLNINHNDWHIFDIVSYLVNQMSNKIRSCKHTICLQVFYSELDDMINKHFKMSMFYNLDCKPNMKLHHSHKIHPGNYSLSSDLCLNENISNTFQSSHIPSTWLHMMYKNCLMQKIQSCMYILQ